MHNALDVLGGQPPRYCANPETRANVIRRSA